MEEDFNLEVPEDLGYINPQRKIKQRNYADYEKYRGCISSIDFRYDPE